MKEISTVRGDVVRKPFVQVQVLATRRERCYVQSERERSAVQEMVKNLAMYISRGFQMRMKGQCMRYLQVLCHIKDPRDVQRVLLVELPQSVQEVLWLNLPNPHEHKLVVGMTREEHRE